MRRISSWVLALAVLGAQVSCSRPATRSPRRPASAADQLMAQLDATDGATRAKAVRALGSLKEPRAVARVGKLLAGDPDAGVREGAAWACGQLRHADLLGPLRAALMDPAASVRREALRSVTAFRSRAAVAVLSEVLASKKSKLRGAALRGLAAMPAKLLEGLTAPVAPLVIVLESGDKSRAALARRLLVAVGEAAVPVLLRRMVPGDGARLDSADLDCSSAACRIVVAMGAKAVPALLQQIREADAQEQGGADPDGNGARRKVPNQSLSLAATTALRAIGVKGLAQLLPLIGLDSEVGEAARTVVQEIGEAAVPGLIKVLVKGKPAARREAADLLGNSKRIEAVAALVAALKDPSAPVRQTAAKNLAEMATPLAHKALLGVLTQGSVPLRLAVVRGLADSRVKHATALLIRALADGKESVAAAAAGALGNPAHGQAQAQAALLKALKGRPLTVRVAAVRALGSHRVASALKPLVKLLGRRTPVALKAAAIRVLGQLQSPKAVKALRRVALGRDKALRVKALESLAVMGGKGATAALKRLAKSRNKGLAKAAQLALKGGPFGIKYLGVPACDEYIRIMGCFVKLLPAAAQAPTLSAFRKTIEALRKMTNGPARSSVGKVCRMTLAAWKKAVSRVPIYKSCF